MSDTIRITVDLERGLADWLRISAATERVSQAAIVRAALEEGRADPDAFRRWVETAQNGQKGVNIDIDTRVDRAHDI